MNKWLSAFTVAPLLHPFADAFVALVTGSSRQFQNLRAKPHDQQRENTGDNRKSGQQNPEEFCLVPLTPLQTDNKGGPAGK
jgi:hypothetical protein